nr:immunoglobulin light chain junction region [Macaca mulatta]MOV66484.1 immunoglobulin light chain junction region [Macaca mulatta]MOV66632.1 immunoglobulin light chain junction region [Macaca mulatta]MOV66865.1 immunoglobulin light chain junction region [Macaca mulatta]MOV66985.1 immunoglobulin light chain junction region [Macaca mulatta]
DYYCQSFDSSSVLF